MNGYLDAVNPAQYTDVSLGGEVHRVERARLGLHLRLAQLAQHFDEANGAEEKAGAVRDYLALCGLEAEGNGAEQLAAYAELRLLNGWQWDLPFMRQPGGNGKTPPYDYPDRNWAWWVHKLASRYGWTRGQIFLELWPEEAACYLQEIFVAEFDEAEERRSLSEVSYRYDKATKKSRFIPLPRPGWMVGSKPPEKVRIPRSWLPVGNVIKLDEIIH